MARIVGIGACVFDTLYNIATYPTEDTKMRATGSKAVGGMSMLVWQAVAAHEIWDGSQYDKDDIDRLCLDAAEELKKF